MDRRTVCGLLPALCLLLVPACQKPVVRAQGEGGIAATYSRPTLSARLPAGTRVPAVIAAADDTMRARGYSVQATGATEEAGTVEARPPRTTDWPKVDVRASVVADTTLVEISVSPWGDQELSRSLLDGILRRLGL